MVGLVIVSHSRALALALVTLVRQVAPPAVPIAVAAGVGDDRQQFGTDALEIMEAIQSVYSADGVLVLMDLGSAVLSAEMAMELLPPEMASHIRICPAPVVEGAIAASVQISLGSDLAAVCREAEGALLPKAEHLQSDRGALAEAPALPQAQGKQIVITLNNPHGLHARPAARFVQTAGRYQAKTQVTNLTTGKGPVSAASLNGLATLGALKGHQVQITASGPEAQTALDALRQLAETNFGETADGEPQAPALSASIPAASAPAANIPTKGVPAADLSSFQATPVSEGIALGPLYPYRPSVPPIPQHPAQDIQHEKQILETAIQHTRKEIEQRYQQFRTSLGEEQAVIFQAHLLFLQDPDLIEKVNQHIEDQHENAAAAWSRGIRDLARAYRALPDAYQQQRAADVEDIGRQVLLALLGQAAPAPLSFSEPVILYAPEITPTETAQLDMSRVLGILTTNGGPTSHSAILARALGIPSITGIPPALSAAKPGTLLAMDGFTGQIQVDPSPTRQQELRARRKAWLDRRQQLIQTSQQPALTRDGRRVEVFANVGSLADARSALQNGAEGVGLLRTEFLFLTRATPPGEAEQLSALREIIQAMGDRSVTVRTLDVGGDKALPYLPLAQEANPFLGVRAIRLSLHQPELFLTQLRAILRSGEPSRLRIMFPMIALLDEVRQAHACLEKAHQALQAEGLPHAWPVETGIMVEIPSAALLSPLLAREVSFFSIGTNDLTQYTLAAERGNPLLAGLADALHPAVLRLMKEVVQAAHAEGKWVSVCGELAGDPQAAPVLVGLGVDELSLNPASIPQIKATLRQVDATQAAVLAEEALHATCAADVRRMAKEFLQM
jgi:multiphosphoryl transfer protein